MVCGQILMSCVWDEFVLCVCVCVYLNILKCTMRQKFDIPRHKRSCVFSVRYFVFNFCDSFFKSSSHTNSPHVIGFCDWTTTLCHPSLGYICCAFLSHHFEKYMNVQYDAFGNLSRWFFLCWKMASVLLYLTS